MEGVLAIVFLFGGASLIGFSFTPLGRALADRIRHGAQPQGAAPDPPQPAHSRSRLLGASARSAPW